MKEDETQGRARKGQRRQGKRQRERQSKTRQSEGQGTGKQGGNGRREQIKQEKGEEADKKPAKKPRQTSSAPLGPLERGRRSMACQAFSADSFTQLTGDSPLPILMHHGSSSDCLPTSSHAHSMVSAGKNAPLLLLIALPLTNPFSNNGRC